MKYRNKIFLTKALILIFSLSFELKAENLSENLNNEIFGLKSQIKQEPENIELKKKLGRIYFKEKKYSDCENILISHSDDLSITYLLILSQCFHEQKKYNEEIKILQKLKPEKNKNFRILLRIALSYSQNKNYIDSIKYYRLAIETNKNHLPSYFKLLKVFNKTKNYYEQRLLLKEMIVIFGEKFDFLSQLCKVFSIEGFSNNTILYCQKAIDKNQKKSADSYVYLAKAYADLNQHDKEIYFLKIASEKHKDSEIVLSATGNYYLKNKDYHNALRYFKKALKLNKDSDQNQLGHAISNFEIGNIDAAFLSYKKACKLNKDNYFYFRKATSKLQQKRDYDRHRKYLRATNRCRLKSLK